MADAFFALSPADRRDALEVAAARSGRAVHLLEKDVWVVWTLNVLFESDFADHLVFKGGTSLSKAYQAIGRFSEDVDLTYDIRAIAPDLVPDSAHAVPSTRSQEQRWTKTIRERLDVWVTERIAPLLTTRLAESGLSGSATAEGDTALLTYEALTSGSGYVRPVVLLEFGARSTGEPSEKRPIRCDAAAHVSDVLFPEASPSVMRPERTFWEKATAIHVFCRGGRFRGAERFSRHWYDVVSLDSTAYVASALADRNLARRVAKHKTMFFRERDGQGDVIDYDAAVLGALQLAPDGSAEELLAADYAGMVNDGLLFEKPPAFAELVARCRAIQDRANNIGDGRRGPG
jgi:hypothetical protein